MKRIGLVLGAGGLTGQAFHAGVLRALVEATDWDPRGASIIVGTLALGLILVNSGALMSFISSAICSNGMPNSLTIHSARAAREAVGP